MSNSEQEGSVSAEFPWETVRLALQSDGEGIYDWDITNNQIQYSSHCSELLGFKKGEVPLNVFTNWDKMVIEEDRAFFENTLRRYIEGYSEIPLRLETRIQKQNGTAWRWIRITGIAKRQSDRTPVRLVGAFVDITRRKTAEAQLEEERHLFRLLIDHIPDNIFFKNRESRFVVANASTARKMNVPTPSDLIGKTDANFFDKEKAKEWRKEEIRIMESLDPPVTHLRPETWKTGKESWCLSTKIPWRGKDGKLKGILGITSDMTSMVHAQQELKRIANELEKKNKALEKEIRLAREVQLALLPQNVAPICFDVDGECRQLTFASRYQASGEVAGDWFEVLPISESQVGIFICDVMGHGVRSALVASMIRGLLEDSVGENPMPAAFLGLVNANLTRILARSDTTMFATAFYMLVDLKNKTLSYATAGHPAPITRHLATQDSGKLDVPRGTVLGMIEGAKYKERTIELRDGMGFLLFTDGLVEATNSDEEEIGEEAIQTYMNQFDTCSAKDAVKYAMECVYQFTGKKTFEDDICLLSFRYTEQTGSCRR